MKINLIFCIFFICLTSCKVEFPYQKPTEDDLFEYRLNELEIGENLILGNYKILPINDYENLLSTQEIEELNQFLLNYQKKTTREIVLVTMDNIEPYSDAHQLAQDIGNYWQIGTKKDNNGVVVLVSNTNRKVAISTGTGAEKSLTDEECKEVIDSLMVPYFREDKMYIGIRDGIKELIYKWE